MKLFAESLVSVEELKRLVADAINRDNPALPTKVEPGHVEAEYTKLGPSDYEMYPEFVGLRVRVPLSE